MSSLSDKLDDLQKRWKLESHEEVSLTLSEALNLTRRG